MIFLEPTLHKYVYFVIVGYALRGYFVAPQCQDVVHHYVMFLGENKIQ